MGNRFVCWIIFVFFTLSGVVSARASSTDTLTIGLFAYRPADQLALKWEPIAQYLEETLKNRTVVLRVLDQQEMHTAIERNELDVVFTNPTHYIRLRTLNRLSGAIATQVTIENGLAVSELGGVIIRHANRPDIQHVADLKNARIAIAGREYLGGFVAQGALLKKHGIDPADLHFIELGNPHDNIVEAVATGRADAGFIRTGILESLAQEGTQSIQQLAVIEPRAMNGFPFVTSTPLYPEWAVAAMPHVDNDTARRLASALLSLEHTHPAAQAAGIYGFTIPKDYRPVEEAMVALRLPPFEKAPNISWTEFAEQHPLGTTLVLSGVLAIVCAGTVFIWLNRRLHRAKQTADTLNTRFQNIADNVPGVIYEFRLRPDGTSHFPWSSSKIHEIYGCSPDAVREDASPVFAAIHPDDLPALQQSVVESTKNLQVWHTTYRVNHPTLGELWLEGSATPSHQADGSVTWHGFIRNITDLQKDREALRLAAQVLAATTDGVLILDKNGLIEQTNPAFQTMTGFSLNSVLGKSLDWLATESLIVNNAYTQPWQGEALWKTATDKPLPVLLSIAPVNDDNNCLAHYVVIANDISALKATQHELDQIAHYDALTGLPNRRLLSERLEQAVALARRSGEKLALAMLDLDEFKPVNDRYGHEAGDLLLVEIARRLQSVLRTEDTVARLGGDEFTLIFRNVQGMAGFERVIETVQQPVELPQGTVHVSASMGVTYLDPDTDLNADQLLRQADMALYRSKEAGRNRYTVFD